MLSLDSHPRCAPSIIGRAIEEEAVLVLPTAGKIKVLNNVGALVWQLCDGEHSVQQIVEMVCQQYDVEAQQAQSDTLKFLDALTQRGMIVL